MTAPAPVPLRVRVAAALAHGSGSRAFEESGREWEAARSAWLRTADTALEAVGTEVETLTVALAEAKRDADAGWAAAQKQQEAAEAWAAFGKPFLAAASEHAPVCGAVEVMVVRTLGPCTEGAHHPSWPHRDASGARWQAVVLPDGTDHEDLRVRLEAAYRARFDDDGHPEDAGAAAEVALSVLGSELDRVRGEAVA